MNIAVYCSAKDCIPEDYLQLGNVIGQWLAKDGHNLVYGGATGGLMTRVSETFKQTRDGASQPHANQKIIGVIPHSIIASGRLADNCDELVKVANMAERKNTMRQIADCFIVLPGSYGTLDEMFDAVSSGTVKEHKKRIYVLNYNGFYDGLRVLFARMKELSFLPENECYRPYFVSSIEELQERINKNHH